MEEPAEERQEWNLIASPSHSLSPTPQWDWSSPAIQQLSLSPCLLMGWVQRSLFPGHETLSPVCSYPIENTKSGKMWLKSAPMTGLHSSKHGEDDIHVLEPAIIGKFPCILSHREVRKGKRGRSHSSSQKKKVRETALENKKQYRDVAAVPRSLAVLLGIGTTPSQVHWRRQGWSAPARVFRRGGCTSLSPSRTWSRGVGVGSAT